MASPLVMADKDKVKKAKIELQLILWESVVGRKSDSRKKVLDLFADEKYFNQNESLLDFTFQQANECKELSRSSRLTVQEGFKYRKYSPLMVAVEEDDYDLAEELLKAKASVAFKNKDRRNALLIACHKGSLRMTTLLLEELEKQWSTTVVRGKPDYRLAINSKHRPNGWTPLMYAVLGGHVEVVEVLLKNTHLKLEDVNSKGQNVFHVAAREGKLECLKRLCSGHGGREEEVLEAIKALDKRKRNILHHVCTRGSLEVLEWLTEKFKVLLEGEKYMGQKSAIIKKKVKDENGQTIEVSSGEYTPFLVACEYKNLNIIKFFMERLPVEKLMESTCYKDCAGISALHLAARHDDRDLFEFLLTKFARCRAGSRGTEETAVEDLKRNVKHILLDTRDNMGDTVLHVARQSSSRGVALLVSEKCSELESVKNKNGEVPSEEKAYFIPPEIIKMGKDAVEAYRKALEEGECKIPYCSMLILGEQRVGKTSLYRQLVGKPYIEKLDPTKGIDNNTVETVDTRSIKLVGKDQSIWEEVTGIPSSSFTKAMTEKAIEEMPETEKKDEPHFSARQEKLLLVKIEKLKKQLLPPSPPPASRNPPHLERSAQSLFQIPYPSPRMVAPVHPVPSPSLESTRPQQSIPRSTIRESASSSQKKEEVAKKEVAVAPTPRHNVEESPELATSEEFQAEETPSLSSSEPDSVPVTAPTPERRVDERGLMNRRQGIFMAKKLRKRNKNEQNSFELTLNAWDFAGQDEYRPMHHCFISRRACYLVVFKIPDLLENACTHLEKIRYWIHSINAHIYPPEEKESEKDKAISRVLLIGTHKESCTMEQLKKADEILQKLKSDKERCANHLIRLKSLIRENNYNNFIPVENSFDFEKKGHLYLKESCTELVQECIKKLSKTLPFLKEDYPIKWLRFKESVEGMASSRPVITMERLEGLAKESLISNDHLKGQEVAIRFLHDSGKIICLKHLPSLFLKEQQKEQLADKVIISPRWMIKIMRKILELDWNEQFHGNIPNAFLQELSCNGIADRHLLQERWSDELETCEILSLDHLCLILQAYCLIFPIHSQDKEESTECSEKYLIPCKWPTSVVSKEEYALYDFKVTFDFMKFLPSEVYYRLVCWLLMSAEREDNENVFSQKESIIHDVRDCDWRVEHKATEHVLEVSMKGCEGKVEDIVSLHEAMASICKDSGLKGLSYHAGRWGKCKACKKEDLLLCMKFGKGEGKILVQPNGDSCQCCNCKKKVNINACLKTTADESGSCLTVADLKDVLEEVYDARSKWYYIGLHLKLPLGTLSAIESECKSSPDDGCRKMLQKWLETGKVRTWRALADALESELVGRQDLKEKIWNK